MTPRIIIGISGASGFQYGVKALELLRPLAIEVHLVVSKGAEKTCELETDYRLDEVMALADVVHPINHLGASISADRDSGSAGDASGVYSADDHAVNDGGFLLRRWIADGGHWIAHLQH